MNHHVLSLPPPPLFPYRFVVLSIAMAIFIFSCLVCLIGFCCIHRRHQRKYQVANRRGDDAHDVDDEGEEEDDHFKCLGRSEGGEEKVEAMYDLVPSLKGESTTSDEPNNQKPRREGQTKRKVRFKNNI